MITFYTFYPILARYVSHEEVEASPSSYLTSSISNFETENPQAPSHAFPNTGKQTLTERVARDLTLYALYCDDEALSSILTEHVDFISLLSFFHVLDFLMSFLKRKSCSKQSIGIVSFILHVSSLGGPKTTYRDQK